jgi:uncharacterized protein YndB with AHSA1/START domain
LHVPAVKPCAIFELPKEIIMKKENANVEALSPITIETIINAPLKKVWNYWSDPQHITQWCHASDDWHAPVAENDLQTGGRFKTVMAARDGSFSFDFEGMYSRVNLFESIDYDMSDGRHVHIRFSPLGETTRVVEVFDPETMHSREMQQSGWQAILDNFKKYVEAS